MKELSTQYDEMFSFAFVRNPWDRLYSSYLYAVNDGGADGGIAPNEVYTSSAFSSFERFVTEWLPTIDVSPQDPVFHPQYLYVYCNGELLVNYIGKVEEFSESLKRVESLSGILIPPLSVNASKTKKKVHYSSCYTRKMVEIVSEVYCKDIDLFNYHFEKES